jgi:hypothetical protein
VCELLLPQCPIKPKFVDTCILENPNFREMNTAFLNTAQAICKQFVQRQKGFSACWHVFSFVLFLIK